MPITKNQVTKRVRLNNREGWSELTVDQKEEVKARIGEVLSNEVNRYLKRSETPVNDGEFLKPLSKEYAKRSGKRNSDMFLDGDMLAQLTFEQYRDGIDFGIFDPDEAIKAYAHHTSYKGHPTIKRTDLKRQFIPKEKGGTFNEDIESKINDIILKAVKNGKN